MFAQWYFALRHYIVCRRLLRLLFFLLFSQHQIRYDQYRAFQKQYAHDQDRTAHKEHFRENVDYFIDTRIKVPVRLSREKQRVENDKGSVKVDRPKARQHERGHKQTGRAPESGVVPQDQAAPHLHKAPHDRPEQQYAGRDPEDPQIKREELLAVDEMILPRLGIVQLADREFILHAVAEIDHLRISRLDLLARQPGLLDEVQVIDLQVVKALPAGRRRDRGRKNKQHGRDD